MYSWYIWVYIIGINVYRISICNISETSLLGSKQKSLWLRFPKHFEQTHNYTSSTVIETIVQRLIHYMIAVSTIANINSNYS